MFKVATFHVNVSIAVTLVFKDIPEQLVCFRHITVLLGGRFFFQKLATKHPKEYVSNITFK